jgi:hypothetical protein
MTFEAMLSGGMLRRNGKRAPFLDMKGEIKWGATDPLQQ